MTAKKNPDGDMLETTRRPGTEELDTVPREETMNNLIVAYKQADTREARMAARDAARTEVLARSNLLHNRIALTRCAGALIPDHGLRSTFSRNIDVVQDEAETLLSSFMELVNAVFCNDTEVD